MSKTTQQQILNKLDIKKLNAMQHEALNTIPTSPNTILLSPTGSGKTVAFLLPIIEQLDPDCNEIQAMILVPSRELAVQIEQVMRKMGSGYKVNAVYGGRAGSKDKLELKHRPAVLIGTPGRVAAHLYKESFSTKYIKTLVLDEFDKSLEIGFEVDMRDIIDDLPNIEKRILTSATFGVQIPRFIELIDPITIDYLEKESSQLALKTVVASDKTKLKTLVDTLCHIGNQPGIIFCNFKDSIKEVSEYLWENKISHGCFYGGMEQIDREKTLIKFRNGTHRIIIATDLAARGIDIPELKFIIHFQLPNKLDEFTHRNGRTARMNQEGTAYVLVWDGHVANYVNAPDIQKLQNAPIPSPTGWQTLFITGGRKDKISKGDIAGLFCKQGKLNNDEIGVIELQRNCAYVSVKSAKANELISLVNNTRLKKKKVRISVV
ncbi:MAG: DEAD/DEAH box helicase [Flavobacteriales bacterium]|nr:DEAD/DEAH box helicase [Flavobacteriales bacterium]